MNLNNPDVFNLNDSKYLYNRTKYVCCRLHTIISRLQTTINVYQPDNFSEPSLFCSDILFLVSYLKF